MINHVRDHLSCRTIMNMNLWDNRTMQTMKQVGVSSYKHLIMQITRYKLYQRKSWRSNGFASNGTYSWVTCGVTDLDFLSSVVYANVGLKAHE